MQQQARRPVAAATDMRRAFHSVDVFWQGGVARWLQRFPELRATN
jgi:hypothetical protein